MDADTERIVRVSSAVILAILGGLLQGSYVVPLKIQRKWLRKYALWEFENNFIIHSTIALFLFPIVIGVGVNVLSFRELWETVIRLNLENWIPPIVAFFFWGVLGHLCYSFGCDLAGIGIPTLITFALNCVLYPVLEIVYMEGWGNISLTKAILVGVAVVIVSIALLMISFAGIRRAFTIRDKMEKQELHEEKDMEEDRARYNENFKAKSSNHHKKFLLGFGMSVIAGVFNVYIFMYGGVGFRRVAASQGIHDVQALATIWIFAMAISAWIGNLVVTIALLISRRTFKKFAITSGGWIFLNKCTNFRGWRLVTILLAIVQALVWIASLLLYTAAIFIYNKPPYSRTFVNEHPLSMLFFIFSICAVCVAQVWTVVFKEWRKKFKKLIPEFIIFVLGTILLVAAMVVLAVASEISV